MIVIITKFTKGAYLVLIAMPILYAIMRAIRKHYSRVAVELASDEIGLMLPSRNHVVVLVSKVHKATLRALAYAQATRPDTLTALTVNVDDDDTRKLLAEWEAHDLPVRLTVLESPYREVSGPTIRYIKQLRADRPRDVVSVFIPEYVVGHWWEHLLHNQSALRLKTRLLFQPGVMVTSVPWQLASSEKVDAERDTLPPPTLRGTASTIHRSCVTDGPLLGHTIELDVGAPAHGGLVRGAPRGAGGVRPARPARRAGSRPRHRGPRRVLRARRRGRDPRRRAGPGRPTLPACGAGPLRGLRLAARVRRGAAPDEARGRARAVRAAWPGSTCGSAERGRGAARRAARLAHPDHLRGRRGRPSRPAPATARTTSSAIESCPLGVPGVGDSDGAAPRVARR